MRRLVLTLATIIFGVTVGAAPSWALFERLRGKDKAEEGTYIERFDAEALDFSGLEKERGLALAIARSEGHGLVPSQALSGYINAVLRDIVAASPVPEVPAQAFVKASRGFGANATADGSIFLNIGLLRSIDSEDELAAILAHELAHVLYRHHGTDWFANSQKFAAQSVDLTDKFKGFTSGAGHEESDTFVYLSVASELSERVIAPNLWNKDQEDEADRLGADILIAAGYNIDAAAQVMARLAAWQETLRERTEKQLEEMSADVQADLEESASKGDLRGLLRSATKGFAKVAAKGTGTLLDSLGLNHYPPEKRAERLTDYLAANHRYAPRSDLRPLMWDSSDHPTTTILARYRAAHEAEDALGQNRLAEAEALARKSVTAPTSRDTLPRVVFSKVREKQGQPDKALRNLEIATQSEEPAFIVYRLMIERAFRVNDLDQVSLLLEEAALRLGDPPHLLPYRISTLVSAEKKLEAVVLASRCKLEHPPLAPECERALNGPQAVLAREDDTGVKKRGIADRVAEPFESAVQ